jgi:hypothetical protein
VALDGAEVVEAVLVAAGANGFEGLGEAPAAREQEFRHDTADDDVAGSNAAVLVVVEGEVNVKRIVPGTRPLPVVECRGWCHFEAREGLVLIA